MTVHDLACLLCSQPHLCSPSFLQSCRITDVVLSLSSQCPTPSIVQTVQDTQNTQVPINRTRAGASDDECDTVHGSLSPLLLVVLERTVYPRPE